MSTNSYSADKSINNAVRDLLKTGLWRVKPGRHRHVRIENVDSRLCLTVPRTPSDWRAAQNWFHQVRRLGVDLPA